MEEIHDKLRGLLVNPALHKALAEAFYTGVDAPSRFDEIDLADHIRHARGIAESDPPFEELLETLQEVIQEFVIDELPRPLPITVEDLTSIAISQLAGLQLAESTENDEVARA